MGVVYRARDTRLGRDVAIKFLPAELSTDAERLHRFDEEARATAALSDPNIVAIFDVGTHEGQPYVVTELLDGETLRHALAAGPLPVRKAIGHAQQIARGMAAAHRRGIVHRDLKPENLFVTRDGLVKILDFGLAKLRQMSDGSTIDGHTMVLGTVATRTIAVAAVVLLLCTSPDTQAQEPASLPLPRAFAGAGVGPGTDDNSSRMRLARDGWHGTWR
jgi:eukaryotic-like serine/threonine-protein kinase